MTDTYTAPRIYAACLASYNDGRLHGEWIDCDGMTGDDLRNAINDMLAKSPCPNVQRRKCPDCGAWQTDAAPYRENDPDCDECGATLPDEFVPSAEEWAIHDHEGFAGMITGEWPDLDEVADLAAVLADDDDDKRRGLAYLVNDLGYKLADAISKCDEVRTFDGTAADYAADMVEDCYGDALEKMPDLIKYHIDWEGVARDLVIGGDIAETTQDGETFLVTNASEF